MVVLVLVLVGDMSTSVAAPLLHVLPRNTFLVGDASVDPCTEKIKHIGIFILQISSSLHM